ncbi:Spindle pole body protein pcp1 [Ophiocordyceps camponoti-floridani]|uniref:Spindle pole body protein pcp1 n=1 Tax=Ophiocordyceps camponoti-floridani TaxID=2030778 RepID=A0A8H4Q868_9HYPO|nr:Spindle pole body protein pcp1 [Ophiocordyceps camponoti-floridani]
MVQPGFGGALDTPRTVADATFLSRPPDLADVSQEATFQSPGRDGNNLLQQMAAGRRGVDFRTPRKHRAQPLTDRRNLPLSVGGAEFTPLLKSATRNSARRLGKENAVVAVGSPALERIDEVEVTPIPRGDTSVYRSQSFVDNAALPQVDSSSVASTPLAMPSRRNGKDRGPLQDGNQLSLREQENVIDRIEKENFGLKLKIHFLEDALRKAGPGYSEAALKENTELKVDKVTMQRELHRYKKQLTSAERDLENYRQQMLELQDRAKRKQPDESQRAELQKLQKTLQEREADLDELQRQVDRGQHHRQTELDTLKDTVEDLEAELREKDRVMTSREDELEEVREKLEEAEERSRDLQRQAADSARQEDLDEAKETIRRLELDKRRLEEKAGDNEVKLDTAVAQRERAEQELQNLREGLADKSMVSKNLSRQLQDRIDRLQEELDRSGDEYAGIEKELARANNENGELRASLTALRQDRQSDSVRVEELEAELLTVGDERDELQVRYDAAEEECGALRLEAERLEKKVQKLEEKLAQEREKALQAERDLRDQFEGEMARLNDDISDLQAEVREKDNLYDNDSDKWENQRRTLESERDRAVDKAAGLQRTIDRLRQAEGSLTDKESKLKAAMESESERHRSEAAMLNRQMDDVKGALEARQALLTSLRGELSSVREELRQTQIDYQTQVNKVVALEDEVEVLQTGSHDSEATRREIDKLRAQLSEIQRQQRRISSPMPATESTAHLTSQLSEATRQLERASKDKQRLQEQVAALDAEVITARTSLAQAEAERDELEQQLTRVKSHDHDNNERLGLRTAKAKLDAEVRRLKEENKTLTSQHAALETSLEKELDKAAAAEDALREQIVQLQAQLRKSSSSEAQELATARRSVRELERRVADYQMQLAAAGQGDDVNDDVNGCRDSSQLSLIRKDLSASRQKELDLLQRESTHRDQIRSLKRQITDLEQRLHEKQVSRLLTHQEESQQQQDLLQRLTDAQDQRQVLEELLDEARAASAQHQQDLDRNRLEQDRLASDARLQQSLVDRLVEHEAALRRKLERARSERAAYRMTAEKLQRDVRQLRDSSASPAADGDDALVVADKERRGLVLQMQWMQARWEREALLRSDAAFAKTFLQLELDVAQACNKAQLRELDDIRARFRSSNKPLPLPIKPRHPSPQMRLTATLKAVRFVVRLRIAAREWGRQEALRLRLVDAFREDQRRR